jgi:hypothetical protein
MWTHTQMSFSSHTFTSLPLVHTLNPDFLRRQLWLCFLLVCEFPCSWLRRFEIPNRCVFATPRLRRFKIPDHCVFATPRLHRFKIPNYRVFATPRFRRFKIPYHREFMTSGLRRFEIPENRKCFAPKKHISRTLLNFDVSRVTGFPEFPNSLLLHIED